MTTTDNSQSIRDAIMDIFREPKHIFCANEEYTCAQIIEIVKNNLSPGILEKATDIDHSIRQALETANGYPCPPPSPNDLVVKHTNDGKRPYTYSFPKAP